MHRRPLGHIQMTISTASIPFTSIPRGASLAVIQCGATNGIRFRDDGTAPTSAIGLQIRADTNYEYDGNLNAIRFIRSGGADATIDIAFYDSTGGI